MQTTTIFMNIESDILPEFRYTKKIHGIPHFAEHGIPGKQPSYPPKQYTTSETTSRSPGNYTSLVLGLNVRRERSKLLQCTSCS